MVLRSGLPALLAASLTAGVYAQQPTDATPPADPLSVSSLAEQPKPAQPFAKGTWALEFSGSFVDAYDAGWDSNDAQAATAGLGLGYHLVDNLALYGQLEGSHFHQDDPGERSADGIGFNLLLRWHLLRFDKFSLYLDGGAGVVQFDNQFPTGGTRFNFTERVGPGITYRLSDNLHLLGGVRFFHLSNADIDGSDENPGLDAVQYYAGLQFAF